ncbi:MAG TPA: PDZ domain-containing protein [Gemmataceae bacterium]|nr:PDZ domain-containing protein [Gemmataceae bacterium]
MRLFRTGGLALIAVVSLSLAAWAQSRDNPDPPKTPDTPKTQPPAVNPAPTPIDPRTDAHRQPGQNATQQRGYLGVMVGPEMQPNEPGNQPNQPSAGNGVEVMDVIPNSPAAQAGLQRGDRITKVGKHQVADVNQFMQAIGSHKPGDKINVDVMRGGKDQQIAVTVGERPANLAFGPQQLPNTFPQFPNNFQGFPQFPNMPQQANFRRTPFIGVQAQPLTPEMKEKLKVSTDTGVIVTDVMPNSPAAQAGLNRDDVITAIDDHPVKTPDDLRNAIQSAGSGKEISLKIMRGTKTVSLKVTPHDGASGFMPAQGFDRIPPTNLGGFGQDQSREIQDLQRRVAELEKKLQQLEAPKK